ncbi:MAG: FGGY-family carbohydrate kinase [Anaerolineaceae bacterium]|nr:FGGY-family carbohydrate kinase [Anaerolineaceae bacterium]
MSDSATILAVDLGTSGVKTALISISGEVFGWEAESIETLFTPGGGVEQRPSDWWASFVNSSRRLLHRQHHKAENIKAICFSTQGEGTIPVDNEGNPLMNCILWMDMRGQPHLQKQHKGLLNLQGVSLSHVVEWVRKTGGMPSATGKDPASHMLFIRDQFPHIYQRTARFLNVLDYINFKLTGRFAATLDSILTSWLTDNRDSNHIHYDSLLIRQSGIDADKLPEIIRCTDIVGEIRPEIAKELGLPSGIKVVGGAIDNTAAAIGAGSIADFDTHVYLGTSSWMAAHVPFKKTDILASLASLPCAIPGRYLLMALQATAGGNLAFLRDKILYNKDRLLREEKAKDIFEIFDKIAEEVPAGARGVIYTPWIWGERAPVEDRTLRAGYFNMSLNNSREDMIRATFEGIAYNTRWLLQPFEKFMGKPIGHINLVGGGAQADVWCQIIADVMNVEIRQVKDPIYANARGAAWIGAVGIGEINFEDIHSLVKIQKIYLPTPEHRGIYDEGFAVFKELYKKLNPIYKRLNH